MVRCFVHRVKLFVFQFPARRISLIVTPRLATHWSRFDTRRRLAIFFHRVVRHIPITMFVCPIWFQPFGRGFLIATNQYMLCFLSAG